LYVRTEASSSYQGQVIVRGWWRTYIYCRRYIAVGQGFGANLWLWGHGWWANSIKVVTEVHRLRSSAPPSPRSTVRSHVLVLAPPAHDQPEIRHRRGGPGGPWALAARAPAAPARLGAGGAQVGGCSRSPTGPRSSRNTATPAGWLAGWILGGTLGGFGGFWGGQLLRGRVLGGQVIEWPLGSRSLHKGLWAWMYWG
jgi:hypothetical protein